MYSLIPFLTNVLAAESQCDYHIQITQVQDATGTFKDDLADLKNHNLIVQLLDRLNSVYAKVDYALTQFQDKPGIITGYSDDSLWWPEIMYGAYSPDSCYDVVQGLTNNAFTVNSAFNRISAQGGKDFMENQWDALRRTAIDPSIGWATETYDDDGLEYVKIAVLITDDAAHSSEATRAYEPRNLNREFWDIEGPFYSYNGGSNPYQICDLTGSAGLVNNRNTVNTASGVSPGVEGADGECFGWNVPKSGVTRSLKGNLTLMNYFYGTGESTFLINSTEAGSSDPDSTASTYSDFTYCCTSWGNTEYNGYCESRLNTFRTWDECVAYGGKYARCHHSISGSASQLNSDCRNDSGTLPSFYTEIADVEPSMEFWDGLAQEGVVSDETRGEFVDRIKRISDYPYDQSIFSMDCSEFEYPDPNSPEYASAFVENNIVPVVISSPPSDSIFVDGIDVSGTGSKANYDNLALKFSEEVCPNMENDPWTVLACQSIPDFNNCYPPDWYPALYPTMSEWTSNFWAEPCVTEECQKSWWSECMKNEYQKPLEQIASTGVSTYYREMELDHSAEIIVNTIMEVIVQVLSDKGCDIDVLPPVTIETTEAPVVVETTEAPVVVPTDGPATGEVGTTEAPVIVETTEAPVVVPTDGPATGEVGSTEAPVVVEPTDAPVVVPTDGTDSPVETMTTAEDDSNVGVIVGSAVGGVLAAGGAVVGALMAKGIIPMGGKNVEETFEEDVILNDVAADREQVAEIGDMFV